MIYFAWRHFRFPKHSTTENLPTLTLAIPARNETLSLVDCLTNVQALEYPKIEVIVLDDQSSDNTSEIIRGFAHAGMRFISGDHPAKGWTGKTYALNQLERAASGKYIAFMDVDVRLGPNDLDHLISYMQETDQDMLSIMPRHSSSYSLNALLEPLRYFWDVFRPISQNRTPVGHRLWIIRREKLAALGGIAAQSYKILPEEGIARRLIWEKKYKFFVSSGFLRIKHAEDFKHEYDSAVRVTYPQLRRKPLRALLAILAHLVLLAPFLLVWLLELGGLAWWVNLVILLIVIGSNAWYAALTRDSWWLTPMLTPLQIILQIFVIVGSWHKYTFGKVDWRGRDIKLVVSKPVKQASYQPAEQYREEYLGDFHVVKDKNKIKKHNHKHRR
ncbi:glycosyltransferase family 2 protein [Candidatus Saccharibacteria bacterium]|nr:glycosyltransferase family 2 protein [Candidatus Saccharibacteria bacterium]